jgi:hypothetical protein
VEQPRGSGYESILFLTKVLKICNGEKTAFSANVVGKSGYQSAKN